MIKNGKYFVAPQQTDEDFKQLFARLTAAGAGRPVDEQGFPDGAWTPETLADAISAIEANKKGIELRAVQVWFQDNDNGISNENMRWLARIFGCDDPEAASQWQTQLNASRSRLAAKRKSRKKDDTAPTAETENAPDAVPPPARQHALAGDTAKNIAPSLAVRTDRLFTGPDYLNLPIAIWGGLGILWFLAFSLGVASVTYSPLPGIDKQVGFIWSPGWNIGEPICLPILLIIVAELINRWKQTGRNNYIRSASFSEAKTWEDRINQLWVSFWAIPLICFGLIFLVQWAGVYLLPLVKGNPEVPMIDWMLLSLIHPEILSIEAAIFVSFFGFLYSGMIYWFLFTALLLLYAMASDFVEISERATSREDEEFQHRTYANGYRIILAVFRCTVLGIFVALSIKVNAAYLVSDAEGIISWLIQDASIFLGLRTDEWTWINGSPSPFFTSFLLLFLICFVFGACVLPVKWSLASTLTSLDEIASIEDVFVKMTVIVAALALAYLAVGQFFGFSLLLITSVIISTASLIWKPGSPVSHNDNGNTYGTSSPTQ